MTGAATRATMLTFQPMVDSEATRLVTRYCGLDVVERDHLLISAAIRTLFRGGKGQIPLLYGKGFSVSRAFPIAQYFDATLPVGRRLIPSEQPLAGQVEADWNTYNGDLGRDAAIFAYYHLLPDRALMQPIFAAPVPRIEAMLLPLTYPVMRAAISLALKLSPASATAAEAGIRAVFDATDQRIADGRRYLAGDRLTIGDVALCASSGPLLLPRGYGALMPPIAAMPMPLRTLMEELRARPTAAFVQRLYDECFPSAN